jgi:drug/metabolite transporter (DMT)-like permease
MSRVDEVSKTPAAGMGISRETLGWILGFLGVLAFSFTLPFTRIASPELGGFFTGIGRAMLAAIIALGILLARRDPLPHRRYWKPIGIVASGTIFGFGPLVSIAMEYLPAAHGVVVVGLLPAATAIMAVLRTSERPGFAFWLACGAGVISVMIFALAQGAGRPHPADLLLLVAVFLAALGYAEGGRLSREMSGWQVICWALVFSMPLLVLLTTAIVLVEGMPSGSGNAWLSLLYLGSVSMLIGFFPWYKGLALGGVARVGQIQLVQPVMSLVWAAIMLGEHISTGTAVASLLVIASAALTRLTRDQKGV